MINNHEKEYTSTCIKLLKNLERLKQIQNGFFSPISIQLSPTDKCNLNCVFCSVKNRKSFELTFDEVKKVLFDFKELGANTVEFTGGGDPTMYPFINESIEYAYSLGYQIGFITNGVAVNKKISFEVLKCLVWLRVSLNSLDYVDDIELNLPETVDLGFSYVWNEKSDLNKLKKINEYSKKYNAKFVRVVPDCLEVENINKYKQVIENYINDFPNFFVQQKKYDTPYRCWMGYIKPFVNSDGYVYHCSANPLIERKFNEKFRLCHIRDIKTAWKNIIPFNTCNCQKGKCFFKEHNDLIEQVIMEIKHKDFI